MSESTYAPRLFVHDRRPDWGVAVIAQDRAVKRSYLFQDGQLRTFSKRFLHLFRPANKPADVARRVARTLGAQVEQKVESSPKEREARASFEQQCRAFRHFYPQGFYDPAYMKRFRTNPKRRRKSHADAGVADARRLLARDRTQAMLDADNPIGIYEAAMKVVDAVHFCTKRNKTILKKLTPERREIFGRALHGLLHHEDEPYFNRFARFMVAFEGLAKLPSWTAVTLFTGLMHPQRHAVVHARTFDLQARAIAPSLLFEREPSAGIYDRLQDLAEEVRMTLESHGFQPRDLIDVHHFIKLSLRPKSLKWIDQPDKLKARSRRSQSA